MSNTLAALRAELRNWPGVTYRVTHRGRHPRLILSYGGHEQFVPFSCTKVGHYGLMQKVTQLRRTLTDMGVTNAKRQTQAS